MHKPLLVISLMAALLAVGVPSAAAGDVASNAQYVLAMQSAHGCEPPVPDNGFAILSFFTHERTPASFFKVHKPRNLPSREVIANNRIVAMHVVNRCDEPLKLLFFKPGNGDAGSPDLFGLVLPGVDRMLTVRELLDLGLAIEDFEGSLACFSCMEDSTTPSFVIG